jgi:hypothetical protein
MRRICLGARDIARTKRDVPARRRRDDAGTWGHTPTRHPETAAMPFRVTALPAAPFAPLFPLSDAELLRRGVVRRVADRAPGFPCRVSLRDAEPGETVLLLHYEHQPAATPYRAGHAIYVREGTEEARPAPGEVPEVLRLRLLSVRAFDGAGMMTDADVVDGRALEPVVERLLADPAVAYLHVHNARPGCYAARIDRAEAMR